MNIKSRVFMVAWVTVLAGMLWVPNTSSWAMAQIVKVPVGTPVTLKLANPVSAETSNAGDLVMFSVVSDVLVNGKVVIPAGSTANGLIMKAKKRNFIGLPASIMIQVNTIQGADGSNIPISVSKESEGDSKLVISVVLSLLCCILFLLMKGGNAEFPAGTVLNATTTAPIEVELK